jgi:multidrug resistance efflux pump
MTIKSLFMALVRHAITWTMVILAVLAVAWYFRDYLIYPWTRDGQVKADVVGIAARVEGPLIQLAVIDNQFVNEGDLLFEIDPSVYRERVLAARARLEKQEAANWDLKREMERRAELVKDNFISLEDFQRSEAAYREGVALLAEARAQLALAELNLSYTRVFAPVDGWVTNLTVARGTYVHIGDPLMAVVDSRTFWVSGYFKETLLGGIQPGDRARIVLMGHANAPLTGVVQGTGWGIFRSDGASNDLLPAVSPTIDWVRLAQRFPVRIEVVDNPGQIPLRIGATATVIILGPDPALETDLEEDLIPADY